MKKTENLPAGQVLGFPVLLGLGVTLLLMAAGSLLVLSGKADAAQIPALALGCLAIGCVGASFLGGAPGAPKPARLGRCGWNGRFRVPVGAQPAVAGRTGQLSAVRGQSGGQPGGGSSWRHARRGHEAEKKKKMNGGNSP